MGLLMELLPPSLRRRADRAGYDLAGALREAESCLRSARRRLESGEQTPREAADMAAEATWLLLLRLRRWR